MFVGGFLSLGRRYARFKQQETTKTCSPPILQVSNEFNRLLRRFKCLTWWLVCKGELTFHFKVIGPFERILWNSTGLISIACSGLLPNLKQTSFYYNFPTKNYISSLQGERIFWWIAVESAAHQSPMVNKRFEQAEPPERPPV